MAFPKIKDLNVSDGEDYTFYFNHALVNGVHFRNTEDLEVALLLSTYGPGVFYPTGMIIAEEDVLFNSPIIGNIGDTYSVVGNYSAKSGTCEIRVVDADNVGDFNIPHPQLYYESTNDIAGSDNNITIFNGWTNSSNSQELQENPPYREIYQDFETTDDLASESPIYYRKQNAISEKDVQVSIFEVTRVTGNKYSVNIGNLLDNPTTTEATIDRLGQPVDLIGIERSNFTAGRSYLFKVTETSDRSAATRKIILNL